MNKTVRILSISVAAAAAAFLSGCSSVDMGPATVVDHSTYSDGAATAPVQTPSLLPGGIVDSGRTHTVAVGDTIYKQSQFQSTPSGAGPEASRLRQRAPRLHGQSAGPRQPCDERHRA